jgi:SIR2-like domain
MENFHDPLKHLKNLRQALSQRNKPIAFLIGAGCPMAVKMPDGAGPLIPDVARLTKYVNELLKSEDSNCKDEYEILLGELEKSGKNPENVEDILSFVRTLKEVAKGGIVRGLDEDCLVKIEKAICSAILGKLDVELPNKNTPYNNLVSWISSIERDVPIEVFTTNYDTLMEQAFEDLKHPYFDGFVGTRKPFFDLRAVEEKGLIAPHHTRYWKIHGSIKWYQSNDNNGEIYRSLGAKKDDDTVLIYPSHLKYQQSRKMPFLALFDRLTNFLKQKDSPLLITLGYSFFDEHINYAITNALRSNPSATVIGLLYGTTELINGYSLAAINGYANAKKIALDEKVSNLSIWTYNEAIIGTVKGNWQLPTIKFIQELDSKENPYKIIERFHKKVKDSNDVESIESTHDILTLSDFSRFGLFLQSLIGDKNQTKDEK